MCQHVLLFILSHFSLLLPLFSLFSSPLSFFLFFFFFLKTEAELIYRVVLVSGVQQSDLTTHIYSFSGSFTL